MDIQRTILWVVFGMSLVFLWDRWQAQQGRPGLLTPPPVAVAEKKDEAQAPAPAPAQKAATPAASDVPQAPATPAAAAPAVPTAPTPASSAERVKIETDVLRAEIDPTGAVLARVELTQQKVAPDWTATGLLSLFTGKKQDKEANVVLLDVSPARVYVAHSGLIGAPAGASFPTHRTPFTVQPGARVLDGQDKVEVKLVSESGGVRLTKTYVFHRGRYDVEVRHEVANIGAEPLNPTLYLQLVRDGNKPEGESSLYYVYTGPAVYTEQDKFRKVEFSDIEKGKATHPKASTDGWFSMIQHYFVSAWVPPQGAKREIYASKVDTNLYSVGSKLPLETLAPGASNTTAAKLYVGPQYQHALEQVAPGLELVVDYGWLTVLAKPLFWLLGFLHGLVGNWGWAIILLTVIVKAAFYPLSAASYKSMARMKEVTPRMMKIREQYGNDKQKMNVAMMELYKNEKINPLGGCLPILVQIPVFIALYWVLLASVETRNAPWILWVHDLATPDPWFVLPVVMVVTMIVQYKLNPTPPDPVQAKVMALMPYIFGVMFFFFPAGLVLYWVVNNVLSIAQQWYITRNLARSKAVG